jgi:hypothetical protein
MLQAVDAGRILNLRDQSLLDSLTGRTRSGVNDIVITGRVDMFPPYHLLPDYLARLACNQGGIDICAELLTT